MVNQKNIHGEFWPALWVGYRVKGFEIEYESEAMTTTLFNPSDNYVEKSIKQEAVQMFLRHHRKSLYMIVGVRIAHGAKVTITRGRAVGGGPNLGPLGLTAMGSPIDANMSIKISSDSSGSQQMSIEYDFVVAYRLKQCRYSRDSGSP